jgi:hypothetical protein
MGPDFIEYVYDKDVFLNSGDSYVLFYVRQEAGAPVPAGSSGISDSGPVGPSEPVPSREDLVLSRALDLLKRKLIGLAKVLAGA